MPLIERYVFRQLLVPTVMAVLALTGVALLARGLSGLDILVNDRQSPLVFLMITLLAMPMLISLVLPIAVLVAALVALNRLHSEQELVICFAGGINRWRLVSPALQLVGLITLLSFVINFWVQPYCLRQMRETVVSVRADLASSIVRPGEFVFPAPGLTVYAREVEDDGTIRNLFVHQKAGDAATTITALEGRVGRRAGSPVLILRNGSNQQFNRDGVLNFLSFDEYVFDLQPFMQLDAQVRYKQTDRYLHELFFPDLRHQWERENRLKLLAEGHGRIAAPLYNIAFMAMAFVAIVGATFSRFGYGGRIAAISALAAAVRLAGFGALSVAAGAEWANVLQYLAPVGATVWALSSLFVTRLPRPTPPAQALAGSTA